MPAEHMGQISRRLRLAFAVASVLFLIALAISPVQGFLREWKHYKRAYVRFAQTRPDTKRLLADYRPRDRPDLDSGDGRCGSLHHLSSRDCATQPAGSVRSAAFSRPSADPASRVASGAVRPAIAAREPRPRWRRPTRRLSPGNSRFCQCISSRHLAALVTAPICRKRRNSIAAASCWCNLNCVGCHRLQDVERPEMIGPDLTNIGTKVSRQWIYKWLKEPRTVTDEQRQRYRKWVRLRGAPPRMPQFRLTEQELRALSGYLSTLESQAGPALSFRSPRGSRSGSSRTWPTKVKCGSARCFARPAIRCRSRAPENHELIGGDIGPELTKVGSKVNPDWLAAWLRDPQSYLPHSKMPRYQWSDEIFTRSRNTSPRNG